MTTLDFLIVGVVAAAVIVFWLIQRRSPKRLRGRRKCARQMTVPYYF